MGLAECSEEEQWVDLQNRRIFIGSSEEEQWVDLENRRIFIGSYTLILLSRQLYCMFYSQIQQQFFQTWDLKTCTHSSCLKFHLLSEQTCGIIDIDDLCTVMELRVSDKMIAQCGSTGTLKIESDMRKCAVSMKVSVKKKMAGLDRNLNGISHLVLFWFVEWIWMM